MVGRRLSHYRVLEELGRGGMGIVYKAEDTKLDRTVAIKVLPPAALSNEDDRARFYREAKAAAQLQHPNIASIYQIDEAVPMGDGESEDSSAEREKHPFIAMEYIDGMTLSEHIKTSPLKISEAVRIVLGVADALKLAHSKEIVHRDIKSSNIMLDSEGRAKVLDFGLAKTAHSTMLTRLGSTIGTVAYMSPEQAKGEDVDNRTDLWALGVVLHELIVGRLPFGGDYEQAIVYSILNEANEPLTSVRTGVPMELERIVNKLLAKSADLRYQTAADLTADLKGVNLQASSSRMAAVSTTGMASTASVTSASGMAAEQAAVSAGAARSKAARLWPLIAAGVAAIALGITGYLVGSGQSGEVGERTYRRMEVVIPGVQNMFSVVSSPDGRFWATRGSSEEVADGLFFYDTHTGTSFAVPNSAGFSPLSFSPNSAWVLGRLSSPSNSGLYRIQVPRGQPIDTYQANFGAWLDDRTLVAVRTDSLVTYDIGSGEVTLIARADSSAGYTGFAQPTATPDGNKVLVSGRKIRPHQDLLLYELDTGRYSVIEKDAMAGTVLSSGHLVYQKIRPDDNQLTFAAFNLASGSFTGPSATLEDPWAINVFQTVGGDASFFMQSREVFRGGLGNTQIGWYDPNTKDIETLPIEAGDYDRVSVAPNGNLIAIEGKGANRNTDGDIITLDLATSSLNRITYARRYNSSPVFGPVSGRLYYVGADSIYGETSNIYVKNADGSGAEEVLVEGGHFPTVSPDEKWIAYVRMPGTKVDLYAMDLETGEEIAVDTTRGYQGDPVFSPDGNYIAYTTSPTESGNVADQALFVRSFPDTGQYYRKVSEDFKVDDPVWSSAGDYLYFRLYERSPFYGRVAISLDGGFSLRSRIEEVEMPILRVLRSSADPGSTRLLLNYIPQRSATESDFDFHVVLNLPALLKEIAPEYE